MRRSLSTCPDGNFEASPFSQSNLSPLWLKVFIIKIVRHPEGYKSISSNIHIAADYHHLLFFSGTSYFANVFPCLLLQIVTHIFAGRVGDLFQFGYDFRVLFQYVITLGRVAGEVV